LALALLFLAWGARSSPTAEASVEAPPSLEAPPVVRSNIEGTNIVEAERPERAIVQDRFVSQGVVTAIDFSAGVATLEVGEQQSLVLHAKPTALIWIPGNVVALEHRRYGDHEWLPLTEDPDISVASTATFHGTVERVDRTAGVLIVDGVKLRAHPEKLRGVMPGQRWIVSLENLSGSDWVKELMPAS